MKNILITSILTLSITLLLGYSAHVHILSKSQDEVEELKESEKLKANEILELKSELKSKNETIAENLDRIANQSYELTKIQGIIDGLKEELEFYNGLKQVGVEATAYTAFCDTGCTGVTATGIDVSNTVYHNGMRVVAVDPRVIPLHSTVVVEPTHGEPFIGVTADTGGDIKNNRIDVLVKNKSKAFEFGRQDAKVTIIEEGAS